MHIYESELFHFISKRPLFFYAFYRIQNKYNHLIVTKRTNIVIEGFPRSANTFAVVAFKYAQLVPPKIAHHLHAPAQIARAAQYSIPAIVIIRHPVEAVISLLLRESRLSAISALDYYIQFYKSVLSYKNHFILAKFEDVINEYGVVIEKVNKTFNSNFNIFCHTQENIEKVFSIINDLDQRSTGILDEKTVARPSEKRNFLKEKVKQSILSDSVAYLRSECESLYEQIIENI